MLRDREIRANTYNGESWRSVVSADKALKLVLEAVPTRANGGVCVCVGGLAQHGIA